MNKKRKNQPILYLILPCYNEEETLPSTISKVSTKMNSLVESNKISKYSKVCYVNDGSTDRTWEIIMEEYYNHNNDYTVGIDLAQNVGHQNALLAGLIESKKHADVMISIDADLQQDINAIDEMIEHYHRGSEIVYGVRKDRKTDSMLKKMSALFFYAFMNLLGCNVVKNHADYRLMSKKAVDCLEEYNESCLFLRGIVSNLGLKSSTVYFEVKEREFGESKYTLRKMFKLATDGITSFSTSPLHLVFLLGVAITLVGFVMIVNTIIAYLKDNVVPGWSTLICSVYFLGGANLLGLGIVGEYCGKIYMESKKRPRYHVDTVLIDKIGKEQ